MSVHRIMLVAVAAGVLAVSMGAATATASGASLGAWKKAMVAANQELTDSGGGITVHPRLDYRNSWGFAARATSWRLHKAFELRSSSRLTARLKAKLKPYLPARSVGQDKRWAVKWQRQAKKNLRHAKSHARYLRRNVPKSLRTSVKRGGEESWREYGRRMKKRAYALSTYIRRTMNRMRNPGGSGPRRWLPLARHEGWPRSSEAMLVKVLRRESDGNPRCRLGVHRGLLQIRTDHAPGRDLYNPRTNLAVGLMLYKRLGWRPWASTAY